MDRAWQFKAGFVALLVILSLGALVPTIFDPGKDAQGQPLPKPEWLQTYEKTWDNKLNLGLDLQGGLLLQYRVEVDKAVSDKVDRTAEDLVERLKRDNATLGEVKITREGLTVFYLDFTDPTQAALINGDFMGSFSNFVYADAGGGRVRLEMQPEYVESTREYAIQQAIGTIRERIDALGVAEPDIKKSGASDIVVQLPGLGEQDFERTKRLIGTTAQLEFKLVDEGGAQSIFSKVQGELPPTLKFSLENGAPTITGKSKDELKAFFAQEGRVPADKQVVFEEIVKYKDKAKTQRDEENSYFRSQVVFRKTELTGEYISSAAISSDQRTGKPYVSLNFDAHGAEVFGKLTTENVNKRFAIVLDDTLKSDPVINEPIPGGRAQITLGGYKSHEEIFQEARDLVIVLRHGALPAPINKQFETSVGPSLGEDSIRKGKLALGVAGALVVFFMLLYYRGGGVIANIALTLNVLFIGAWMSALNATLTLPWDRGDHPDDRHGGGRQRHHLRAHPGGAAAGQGAAGGGAGGLWEGALGGVGRQHHDRDHGPGADAGGQRADPGLRGDPAGGDHLLGVHRGHRDAAVLRLHQ
jgi:protein-export membrane protein SecD